MRPLFWKEWRENRLIVLGSVLLLFVLMVGCVTWFRASFTHSQDKMVDAETIETLLYATWLLSALMCGSSMVAPEISQGTLSFLSALPVSRPRIWLAKFWAANFVLLLSMALSMLLYLAIYSIIFHFGDVARPLTESVQKIRDILPLVLVASEVLFAVSAVMTMLVDRPVSALVASLVSTIAFYSLVVGIVNLLPRVTDIEMKVFALILLFIPTCLYISFQTFVHGEINRTSTRFRVVISSLLQSILIVGSTLLMSYLWIRSW